MTLSPLPRGSSSPIASGARSPMLVLEPLPQAEGVPTVPARARPLLRSWARSKRAGADLDGRTVLEEAIVDEVNLRDARARFAERWRGTESVLEDFASLCSRRDFVAVLADAEGVVTQTLGGGSFESEAERLRLIGGAAWHEALRGTNAIGTAIAENRAVSVHGEAHFARVNQGLCCFAAPVHDHRGQIVGVLDATSHAERGRFFDPSVVLTVARAIEEVLRTRAYAAGAGGIDLVERLIERASGAAMLVERPGRVVRCNHEARQMLSGRDSGAMLPPWDKLEAHARSGWGPLHWSADGREESAVEITTEALTDVDGELIALLVFLEPLARRLAPMIAAKPGAAPIHLDAFSKVIGADTRLHQARQTSARIARSALPVLLLAETGTGKELFARAIHEASPRAAGPFVPVNCGAIQKELLLSELFGHAPGAFTGAARGGREGLISRADGGTLFLDEVAEMSADAQVALLRVLEDGGYARVGGKAVRQADIRVVAATCRDLHALVESGEFRQDLFFRIGGALVELPALRDRSDFTMLLDALWSEVRTPEGGVPPGLSIEVRERLAGYAWPGNVRELKSVLEFAAVLACGGDAVLVEHLPAQFAAVRSTEGGAVAKEPAVSASGDLQSIRREALEQALRQSGGNVSAAARSLGVARSTVYRLARRLGVEMG